MVQVHLDRRRMRRGQRVTAWTPLIIEGIWKQDSWGGGWLEVERYEILPIEKPKG
jgi:hypothetical protein